jgi:hypothetical protein
VTKFKKNKWARLVNIFVFFENWTLLYLTT